MSLLNSVLKKTGKALKGTGSFLANVAEKAPLTTEERVVKSIKSSMSKDNKLQFAIIAFKDRYGFGMRGINIEPQLDVDTLNVTGWKAMAKGKVLLEANGLDEIYAYFAKGVMTTDKEEIEQYRKETEAVLS